MNITNRHIMIATGGTGGHLYPGIALARELKLNGVGVTFILKQDDNGKDIVTREGFDFLEIPVIGMPRKISLRFILFFIYLIKSYRISKKILLEKNPWCVVGMGGYISFPLIFAASRLRIRTVVHEQNVIPGLANKLLGRFVDKIALTFQDTVKYFPEQKTYVTGNPVRKELFFSSPVESYARFNLSNNRFTVLVFGGSQGAKRINQIFIEALMFLVDVRENVQFVHIIGKDDVESTRKKYKQMGFPACVLSYLDTIGDAYAVADLIICRSGATTVSELQILNKPAILIPFPFATENHQEFNAMPMVNNHQAVMIKENDLRPDILAEAVKFRLKSFNKIAKNKPNLPQKYPQELISTLILQD